jgi:hypothetical protein
MVLLMKLLGRLFLIVLAYIVATLAAALVLALAGLLASALELTTPSKTLNVIGASLTATLYFWLYLVVWLAALPFLIAIILAEILKIRSILVYAFFGGVLGFLAAFAIRFPPVSVAVSLVMWICAGTAAGLGYWIIAGRHAGNWKGA